MRPTTPPDERRRFYERPLSGGGYVAIETVAVRTLFGGVKFRGEIVVERRTPARQRGHIPPVAACAEYARVEDAVRALLPFARSEHDIADVLGRKVVATVTAGRRVDPNAPRH